MSRLKRRTRWLESNSVRPCHSQPTDQLNCRNSNYRNVRSHTCVLMAKRRIMTHDKETPRKFLLRTASWRFRPALSSLASSWSNHLMTTQGKNRWILLPEFTVLPLPIFFYLFASAVLSAPWSREPLAAATGPLSHAAVQTGPPSLQ